MLMSPKDYPEDLWRGELVFHGIFHYPVFSVNYGGDLTFSKYSDHPKHVPRFSANINEITFLLGF